MENGGNYWSETEDRPPPRAGARDSGGGDPPEIGRYRVIRRLGQGGFGRVYLARDDDLDRSVAVKVPNNERIAGPGDVDAYLAEARALAKLDHPHIVPVYDVGRTADGLCFVVSRFVDGSDLAGRIRQGRPSFRESAELAAVVAEALHHAHTRGLVHRDIKPANILIDAVNEPWVADFGLALKDEDYGKGARLAGTPAYMSPEQARGEGHRVDGRSDIFSLGVVLYELLTGRKPFRGDTRAEVMDQIATADPRPPRQIDDTIPRELERICQKALAKRASERYGTGRDLADDLRHFLQTDAAPSPGSATVPSSPHATAPPAAASAPISTQEATPVSAIPGRSDSDGRAIKIVPKGLRSFDRHDASFFLELLPGPRDREGLPEGLRFWKTRIESIDPDATFKVGLIYGPSGCGKSSLVKAGLLPRLHKDIVPVYFEATQEETEARLLRGVRKACPELGTGMDLVDSLAALRRGRVLRSGQKLLLVLDQFEQWLFARRGETDPELVAALRQCDGEHIQAVVMVRDDFWMAATRFMRDLEIRIVEGENSAAVDLFDLMHARRVLAAFGRAYGVLPEKSSDLTPDQKAFLEQSVAGLAHDGKIISVRLALFAEMVKGKPWSTATLRDVGGARGIGVTFLDETFGAATAPPEHRLHQRAAQAVLKALLPGTGTDIKGQMRSEAELREASGYASRPRDFEDLIGILDRELRLITPTDPEGAVNESQSGSGNGQRFYQLTHDYLVPSLREWLTRKQRESRRGRAELRLAERAAIWESRPEIRHLPSVPEWVSIRTLTRPKDWTEPQRAMMRRAGLAHGLRALAAAIGIVGLAIVGLGVWDRVAAERRAASDFRRKTEEDRRQSAARSARDRVQHLLTADTADVPALIREMAGDPLVDQELERVVGSPLLNDKARLHASLARLPTDPAQVAYLREYLPKALPHEVSVLRDSLDRHRSELTPRLWPQLQSTRPGDARILPIAAVLARYDPDNEHWPDVAGTVARAMVAAPDSLDRWLDLLRPVGRHLAGPLGEIFRARDRPEAEHDLATRSLVEYAGEDPDKVADLLMDADPGAFARLFAVAAKQVDRVSPVLRSALDAKPKASRDDPALDHSRTKPDAAIVRSFDPAGGLLDERERLAFCQSMPLAEFRKVAEGLRKSGFRPVRLRPYADGSSVKVAAVWNRDDREWRMEPELSADEMRRADDENGREKFIPADVAGYIAIDDKGKPVDRYAALWVKAAGGDEARMYVGATADEEDRSRDGFKESGLIPLTLQVLHPTDGRRRACSVWVKPRDESHVEAASDLFEGSFPAARARRSDAVLIDVSLSEPGRLRTARERVQAVHDLADKVHRRKPGNLDAMRSRARASLRLGEAKSALGDLNLLIGAGQDDAEVLLDRAIAQARLRNEEAALADHARFQQAYAPDEAKLSAAVILAAELGQGDELEKAIRALDAALANRPEDADLRLEAARAFAVASKPGAGGDPAKRRRFAGRAVQLLRDAVRDGDADFGRMDDDPALDPIRDDPAFVELMNEGHPGRRYAAVWAGKPNVQEEFIEGVDPARHLERAGKLMKEGYRPVAWSVAPSTSGRPPIAASVWHRPVVSERERDALAERQARAAVALIRMGRDAEVWDRLRHGEDPRLRSFIVAWLEPLRADSRSVIDAFRRIDDSARRDIPTAPEKMTGVLFDHDTSIRRALILALGLYSPGALPAGQDEALTQRFLSLYRTDPDAGIHGAAEWTLRRWGAKIDRLAADARTPEDRGARRWFVNKQGQTFAVIDGPIEFRMGSPATEPGRTAGIEAPHTIRIPRSFAISTREVTVEQFREFLKTHDQFNIPPGILKQYTSAPDGPWIAAEWYAAAAYCNWLSEKEDLPADQWCYEPNEFGAYAEGMKIPNDAMGRRGYRLPTEAEWEYACRAGAATSRYYGVSTELLEKYAWHKNQEHAQPGGGLLPNDLGLFDMLGNVYEWCQDRDGAIRPSRKGVYDDLAITTEVVRNRPNRILRGGSFYSEPSGVRSASRTPDAPSFQSPYFGFRVARTLETRR